MPLEQARAELARAEAAHQRADRDLQVAEKAALALGPQLGQAQTLSEKAAEDVHRQTAQMVAAGHRFTRCLTLPGLAAAATADTLSGIVHPEQVAEVRSAAQAALSAVAAPRQPPSLTTLLNAFREFDREVSGQASTCGTH
jgi:hypothetical protein